MTTARKLYEFLEMRQGDYNRWCKKTLQKIHLFIESEDTGMNMKHNNTRVLMVLGYCSLREQ